MEMTQLLKSRVRRSKPKASPSALCPVVMVFDAQLPVELSGYLLRKLMV